VLNYLIFILLAGLGIYFLPKFSFLKTTGLSPRSIRILFFIKVTAGVLIGWVSHQFYKANDYWDMNKEGYKEYQILKNNPIEFISNLFYSPYADKYGRFFSAVGSYWNDLRNNMVIKLVAIFNLIAGGNYYINSLLFNFIAFFGCVAMFKLLIKVYPKKIWQSIFCAFLMPSTLYFTSGIHKDLIIITSLSFYCYFLYATATQNAKIKNLVGLSISLIFILLVRNFILIPLIPISIIYILSNKYSLKPSMLFLGLIVLSVSILLIWDLTELPHSPLGLIVDRQHDFLELDPGESQLFVTELQPNLKDFILNLPSSLEHVFLRPFIWEQGNFFYIPVSAELLFIQIIFVLMLFFRSKDVSTDPSMIWLFLILSLFMFLVIGFTIPNLGAIVRYRSIYLPFLVFPIICSVRWEKLNRIRRIIK